MARPRIFDLDAALDAAIAVFREHGYAGTSAQMLVSAMGIGRQSLYDTFGDKWQLYQQVLRRHVLAEGQAHRAALKTGPRAVDGIAAMVARVVRDAEVACLGVGSVAEFGCANREISAINAAADRALRAVIVAQVRRAQDEGDLAGTVDAEGVAAYLIASIAGIRLAARGGADAAQLEGVGAMVMRALR